MENDNCFLLRQRFLINIQRNWNINDHSLKEISCVYSMLSIDYDTKTMDIVYIGSTTRLCSRYRSHKIPEKIQESGKLNLMYFVPMDKGFYDYEIKLIKKLQPIYNKQHK
jgi:hypothetical protein